MEDDVIFPKEFGSDVFEVPTKSSLYDSIKMLLSLSESVDVKVKDICYSEKIILVTFDTIQADGTSD